MLQTPVNLPNVAWEQAVYVSLFVVFCLALVKGLLAWFSKQQQQWQNFIQQQNKDWRTWMTQNEERMANSLLAINKSMERVLDRLNDHDQHVEERVSAASQRKTLPRKNAD